MRGTVLDCGEGLQKRKRWHGGDQRERWVRSGLLVAQRQFRRVGGLTKTDSSARQELEMVAPSKLRKLLSGRERRHRVDYTGVGTFNEAPSIPNSKETLDRDHFSLPAFPALLHGSLHRGS